VERQIKTNIGDNMPIKDNLIGLAPDAIKLAVKIIRYAQQGFTKEEKQELAGDLIELAVKILESIDTSK